MANPFVGEIRIFGFNFAPVGWAQCLGQLIPISQNTALFSLLGTQFGGNGQSNFALPDLQGCVPMDQGTGPGLTQRVMGETSGSEAVTLSQNQMPLHTHATGCNTQDGDQYGPPGFIWAPDAAANNEYASSGGATMAAAALTPAGSDLPHSNLQPYLVMNFCIALQGVFPSRN